MDRQDRQLYDVVNSCDIMLSTTLRMSSGWGLPVHAYTAVSSTTSNAAWQAWRVGSSTEGQPDEADARQAEEVGVPAAR